MVECADVQAFGARPFSAPGMASGSFARKGVLFEVGCHIVFLATSEVGSAASTLSMLGVRLPCQVVAA